ncbi:LEA domain protein [Fusarium beomiforme]|uniref:LEA domain protein n=1 Tax=Fusarium beomiforme TaxID=44412 RepID=A0A9P5DRT3_9HYPO|nr:LEA domain protein [Fusarium beomiforme]
MSKAKDSTAITEEQSEDTKKGTASREQQNPVNLESVPRSVAGVVNNAGDILGDAGNIIGKIADIDSLKHFVGNDVNSTGDVVSSLCDVFGKTLSLGQEKPGKENQEEQQEEHRSHDDECSEYTIQEAEKKSDRLDISRLKDAAGGLTGAISDTGKSDVGGGIGALDLGGKPDETPEALKQAEEAIGQMPEVKAKAWDAPDLGIEQTPEERLQREQAEQVEANKGKELASALAYNIDQTQDKIRPICKMINDNISASEAQLREEHSEEELVRKVQPLIEEGAKILADLNGVIRGLDPDGRIQRNAKQKAPIGEATPEEYHLAELLTSNITATIDNARHKLENMPHAKKELNPLWTLLVAPLFQIITSVGLLLDGVLGLVSKLLYGDVISSLTGQKKK